MPEIGDFIGELDDPRSSADARVQATGATISPLIFPCAGPHNSLAGLAAMGGSSSFKVKSAVGLPSLGIGALNGKQNGDADDGVDDGSTSPASSSFGGSSPQLSSAQNSTPLASLHLPDSFASMPMPRGQKRALVSTGEVHAPPARILPPV